MIKKLQNGDIILDVREDLKTGYYDKDNIENFYHDEMFMNDLYFTYIGGTPYIIDTNTQLVYHCPCYLFSDFINNLFENRKIKLKVLSKGMSKMLYYDYLDMIGQY